MKTPEQIAEEKRLAEEAAKSTPDPEPEPEPSFKDDPKYQAMAKQLAAFQDAEKARLESEAQAKKEAEEKALRDAGKFDELAAKHQAELDKIKAAHDAELLHRDIESSLLRVDFNNDLFIKGAIQNYNSETHGDVSAYAEMLAKDESNKGFLAGAKTVHKAAAAVPAGGPDASLRGDKLKAAAKSDDPKLRMEAIKVKEAYYEQHGTFDGLYD